jgi:hypothetical protein
MAKSKLTQPITLTVTKLVSQMLISNLICSAMESGVYGSGWLRAYDAEGKYGPVENDDGVIEDDQWIGFKITKPKGNGAAAEGNEQKATHTNIGIEEMTAALQKLLSDPKACKVADSWAYTNLDDADAEFADLVVQVAVFGEVIYG